MLAMLGEEFTMGTAESPSKLAHGMFYRIPSTYSTGGWLMTIMLGGIFFIICAVFLTGWMILNIPLRLKRIYDFFAASP
jgi:hypothetical protein